MPCRYLLENSHKFLCIVISCEGNSTIERISVSQFSFLSILFYYFRKIPFSHFISPFRIYRWSTYNFSLFISISLTASLISFFWRRFYQKNVFALFTLATGLAKRFSWRQIEKWNLLDLYIVCVLFVLYMNWKFIIESKRKFSNREIQFLVVHSCSILNLIMIQ